MTEQERQRRRRVYAGDPESHRVRSRRYYADNRDSVLAKARQKRAAAPEKARAYHRAWRRRNLSRVIVLERQRRDNTRREYERTWYAKNRKRIRFTKRARYKVKPPSKKKRRERRLRREYSLSVNEWSQLFALQGSRCACCRARKPGTKHGWSVDHEHGVKYPLGERWRLVRGIVCYSCNRRLSVHGDTLDSVATSVRGSLLHTYLIRFALGEATRRIQQIKGLI